jgi:hypothetical protein
VDAALTVSLRLPIELEKPLPENPDPLPEE